MCKNLVEVWTKKTHVCIHPLEADWRGWGEGVEWMLHWASLHGNWPSPKGLGAVYWLSYCTPAVSITKRAILPLAVVRTPDVWCCHITCVVGLMRKNGVKFCVTAVSDEKVTVGVGVLDPSSSDHMLCGLLGNKPKPALGMNIEFIGTLYIFW